MAENFANTAQTTLNGALDNSQTNVVVTSATGFPAANFRIIVDSELMLVTTVVSNTFTVTRNIEGTSAASHSNGATVTHILTAGGLAETLVDLRYFIRANATRTFTSNTTAQNIFTDPANGRITLPTGVYHFHGQITVTGMSTTSGNAQIDWLGGGTATVTKWLWFAWGLDTTADVAGSLNGGSRNATNLSAASIFTAAVGQGLTVQVDGSFDVTGAGTLTPTFKMVTAAASVLSIGSYLMYERMGASGVISTGPWD